MYLQAADSDTHQPDLNLCGTRISPLRWRALGKLVQVKPNENPWTVLMQNNFMDPHVVQGWSDGEESLEEIRAAYQVKPGHSISGKGSPNAFGLPLRCYPFVIEMGAPESIISWRVSAADLQSPSGFKRSIALSS